MQIQQARSDDIPQILAIAKSHYLEKAEPSRISGFFQYLPSRSFFKQLVGKGMSLVAAPNTGGEICGFATVADEAGVREIARTKKDNVFEHLATEYDSFIYVDMLASRNPHSMLGARAVVGLMERILEFSSDRAKDTIGVIAESPWENRASLQFVKRYGFVRSGQIENGEEGTLGVYIKESA